MKEFFGLKCKYEDMSPVLIPAGYTRDYIDGKIAAGEQLKDVHEAFQVRSTTIHLSRTLFALCSHGEIC